MCWLMNIYFLKGNNYYYVEDYRYNVWKSNVSWGVLSLLTWIYILELWWKNPDCKGFPISELSQIILLSGITVIVFSGQGGRPKNLFVTMDNSRFTHQPWRWWRCATGQMHTSPGRPPPGPPAQSPRSTGGHNMWKHDSCLVFQIK